MSTDKQGLLTADLRLAGFNLLSVQEPRVLGDQWSGRTGCVLLIGNAGPLLWQVIPQKWFDREHPIDDYSAATVRRLVEQHFPDIEQTALFPYARPPYKAPPLQQLGRVAGWHHDSPLGTGINASHGLWFAYRAVVFLAQPLAQTESREPDSSPCLSCVSTPCVSACPAQAVQLTTLPDMQLCGTFRLRPQSMCEKTCLARLACPVAVDFRYREGQIAYHYERSLGGLKRWLEAL